MLWPVGPFLIAFHRVESIIILYMVKEVVSFLGLGQLMVMAHKRMYTCQQRNIIKMIIYLMAII